jgi:hypothetical protein
MGHGAVVAVAVAVVAVVVVVVVAVVVQCTGRSPSRRPGGAAGSFAPRRLT